MLPLLWWGTSCFSDASTRRRYARCPYAYSYSYSYTQISSRTANGSGTPPGIPTADSGRTPLHALRSRRRSEVDSRKDLSIEACRRVFSRNRYSSRFSSSPFAHSWFIPAFLRAVERSRVGYNVASARLPANLATPYPCDFVRGLRPARLQRLDHSRVG